MNEALHTCQMPPKKSKAKGKASKRVGDVLFHETVDKAVKVVFREIPGSGVPPGFYRLVEKTLQQARAAVKAGTPLRNNNRTFRWPAGHSDAGKKCGAMRVEYTMLKTKKKKKVKLVGSELFKEMVDERIEVVIRKSPGGDTPRYLDIVVDCAIKRARKAITDDKPPTNYMAHGQGRNNEQCTVAVEYTVYGPPLGDPRFKPTYVYVQPICGEKEE